MKWPTATTDCRRSLPQSSLLFLSQNGGLLIRMQGTRGSIFSDHPANTLVFQGAPDDSAFQTRGVGPVFWGWRAHAWRWGRWGVKNGEIKANLHGGCGTLSYDANARASTHTHRPRLLTTPFQGMSGPPPSRAYKTSDRLWTPASSVCRRRRRWRPP